MSTSEKPCISCFSMLENGRTRYCTQCRPGLLLAPTERQQESREAFRALKELAHSFLNSLYEDHKRGWADMARSSYRRYCGVLDEMLIEVRAFHFQPKATSNNGCTS